MVIQLRFSLVTGNQPVGQKRCAGLSLRALYVGLDDQQLTVSLDVREHCLSRCDVINS